MAKTLKLTTKQFETIIKEHAKRYQKTLQLEARKVELEKELKMLYEGDEEMMEGLFGQKDYSADAKKALAAGQNSMKKYANQLATAKIESLGPWAAQIVGNPQGILNYLNAKWEATYIANKGNMVNMKFNPKTGEYEKSQVGGTNTLVGALGENEQ